MHAGDLSLERWANFWVCISTAAAALVGIMFVVISLATGDRNPKDAPKIRVYLTPVVIYFSSIVFIGLLLTMPAHTPATAGICVCLGGVAGLGYSGSLAIRRGRGRGFYEHPSDLLPYVVLPFVAYLLTVSGGLLLFRAPQIGVDLVAAGMLALLAVAIRNSWAIAVTILSGRA